jgi:hypothetical protein
MTERGGNPTVSEPTDEPDDQDVRDELVPDELSDHGSIEDLLRLVEIDPEALADEAFEQTQAILNELGGKTIRSAEIKPTRIELTLEDGNVYFFYGFMGSGV